MRKLCKVDQGLLLGIYLVRKDTLINGNSKMISCHHDYVYNYHNSLHVKNCEINCNQECDSKYYTIKVESKSYYDRIKSNNIDLFHSEYPDIFVRHMPEISLISFLCNFGRLLGMWLGQSLFGIINDIFNKISKYLYPSCVNNYLKINRIVNVQFKSIFPIPSIIIDSIILKYIIKKLNIFEKFHLKSNIRSFYDIYKLKAHAKCFFKIIIIFVSISGLIYQVQIIYNEYMNTCLGKHLSVLISVYMTLTHPLSQYVSVDCFQWKG